MISLFTVTLSALRVVGDQQEVGFATSAMIFDDSEGTDTIELVARSRNREEFPTEEGWFEYKESFYEIADGLEFSSNSKPGLYRLRWTVEREGAT